MISIDNKNHWLIQQVDRSSSNVAVITEKKKFTYNEVYQNSLKIASHLFVKGINAKDHVAIISENSFNFIVLINSLWLIGAIPIPLNIRQSDDEIKNQIEDAKCKHLIIIDEFKIYQKIKNCEIHSFPFEEYSISKEKLKLAKFSSSNLALLMFTSGSSGKPKCVKLSFQNLFESALSADSFINHSTNDIWLASLPFYHIGGFSIITRALISGRELVIPKSLSEENISKSIKMFQPSLLSMVDLMFKKLIARESLPWNNLKNIFLGGGPISEEVLNKSISNNWPVALVYGSTETSSMVTVSSIENLKKNGISAGVPLKNVKIKISDEGRIMANSPSVSDGYLNLYSDKNLQDGTYISNDIGEIDSSGNLHIIGRTDNIIISGGENISLSEIEMLLNKNDSFGSCTTLAVKDENWGQSYIIVTDSKKEDIKEAIKNYLESEVGRYKLPKEIIYISEIPKSELGKVQKGELKESLNADFL